MEASTALLLRTVEELRGEERLRAIRERFLAFESRNDEGRGFFTGYYEPELRGSLDRTERCRVPVYGVPPDLVAVDLAPFVELGILPEEVRRRSLRGRLEGRRLVPYDDRERIADRKSLEGRAEPIAWVDDPVDLFFLQIQGSGRIRLEDGSVLRVNYADRNGRPYVSIGKLLLDRIPRERMSLQSLKAHLREHPEEASKIMNANPSYTFFRIVEEGPLGNIEVPLTPGRSVAMDAALVPRGGAVWIETTLSREASPTRAAPATLRRYAVVQDTGGAITGHGRVDLFWGAGRDAERIAGHMKQEGRVFLLVARKELLGKAGAGP